MLRAIKESFVMLIRWLLDSTLERAGCQENQPSDYRIGTSSLTSWTSREQRGPGIESVTGGQGFNQSCLFNEASMKTLSKGFGEFPGWGTLGESGTVVHSQGVWKLWLFPHTSPCAFLPFVMHRAISFCNKLVN